MKIIDKLQNMGLPELLALADFAEEISEKKYQDLSLILDILKVRMPLPTRCQDLRISLGGLSGW
jgi:hypothetical protein